jgi:hypothetical protein
MPDNKTWSDRFDEEFVKDNGENINPSFIDPNGDVGPVKAFFQNELEKLGRELLTKQELGDTAQKYGQIVMVDEIIDTLAKWGVKME